MLDARTIAAIIIIAVLLIFAFPFHEFAHALAAYRLGDSTAKLFGRLTLDPRRHFDPTGGLLLAISALGSGGTFAIGWAKPTPVNPMNLRGGRRGEAIVAAAGPLSNLVLAGLAAIPYRTISATAPELTLALDVLFGFIAINVALMVFNLLPIPPLDGSKVLYAMLDPRRAWQVKSVLDQYGFLILFLLVFSSFLTGGPSILGIVFDVVAVPIIRFLTGL